MPISSFISTSFLKSTCFFVLSGPIFGLVISIIKKIFYWFDIKKVVMVTNYKNIILYIKDIILLGGAFFENSDNV